jgi:hypothetical protein
VEEIAGEEWASWYALSPSERLLESMKLWDTYLALRLSPSPIRKALSLIRKSGARTLLMGGQACVFYRAAEFSRGLHLLVLADAENLASLQAAVGSLNAELIGAPPLNRAICCESTQCISGAAAPASPDCGSISWPRYEVCLVSLKPWERRTTIEIDAEPIDLLSIQDLVCAKKTPADKGWPMIRRLVEQRYLSTTSMRPPLL